ncbi:MAG: adenylate cyclase [Rhizobiaceae bacterium MnEN-MB40S]|nr:MAG: adenylate cyclase [Rhizobiaceae bacterium MnEN-MB40S]
MGDGSYEFKDEFLMSQLDKIIDSADFDASERNKAFLRYVVNETLAGRGDRIKAYNIATTVFGRDEKFDPILDSIVRIEAGRLRRSLERYYLTVGANDPVEISIPKGSYVPVFATRNRSKPDLTSHTTPDHIGPTILVRSFDLEGGLEKLPNFERSLVRHIIIGLTKFTDLFVYGPDTSYFYESDSREDLVERLGVDYSLQGNITFDEDLVRIEVFLLNAHSGQYVWADLFERPLSPKSISAVRDDIADEVVRVLAQPYGIIYSQKASDDGGEQANDLDAFRCVSRFHKYWRTFDPDLFEEVRQCLEHTTINHPFYAEAFACLSQVYTNAFRYRHDVSKVTTEPMSKALHLAFRAVELAPRSSQCYFALGLAYWFLGDTDSCIEAYEVGRKLNPNDTQLTGELGFRYAMQMDWDKAIPLIKESYSRNPAQSGTFRMGLALHHYSEGRCHLAIDEVRKVDAPTIPYQYLITAACYSRLGEIASARDALAKVLEIVPEYGDVIVDDMIDRSLHPDLISAIVEDVSRAGLVVPEAQRKRIGSKRRPA